MPVHSRSTCLSRKLSVEARYITEAIFANSDG